MTKNTAKNATIQQRITEFWDLVAPHSRWEPEPDSPPLSPRHWAIK